MQRMKEECFGFENNLLSIKNPILAVNLFLLWKESKYTIFYRGASENTIKVQNPN